jgi:hypothetical protein
MHSKTRPVRSGDESGYSVQAHRHSQLFPAHSRGTWRKFDSMSATTTASIVVTLPTMSYGIECEHATGDAKSGGSHKAAV